MLKLPSRSREIDETPDFHAIICDSKVDERTPWTCCGRSFFRSALDALKAETRLTICASFEHEFSVSGKAFEPAAPFSIAAAEQQNRFLTEPGGRPQRSGSHALYDRPEYGLGQYEAACAPEVGIKAADACLITRETIRAIARRHGLSASFTPKPSADAVGNGAHIHLSLVDEAGQNQTYDPAGPMNLSAVAAHFSAGILEHHRCALGDHRANASLLFPPRSASLERWIPYDRAAELRSGAAGNAGDRRRERSKRPRT